MKKQLYLGGLLLSSLTMLACERQSEVKDEMQDLQEARQKSPEVAKKLEHELAEAKSEIVKLEEKLALAKQGVTDEVAEEQRELDHAVQNQAKEVREEVKEAQGAANTHNIESQRAREALQRTQPTQRVEAEVHTETRTVPTGTTVEVKREQQAIPIDNSRVVQRPLAPAPNDVPKD